MATTLTLISGPAELAYSRNEMTILLETTALDTLVLLDIYDAANNKLTTLQGRPDNAYHVSFEISSILDTIVEFDKPALATGIVAASSPISLYHAIATEVDSSLVTVSTLSIGWDGTTASLRVIKGGLSLETAAKDVLTYLKTNTKFLTWRKSYNVTKKQPFFLYYLHQIATETVDVQAKVYYNDGTTASKSINQPSVTIYGILRINAGYAFNDLDAVSPAKTAWKYEITVFLTNTTTVRATIPCVLKNEDYFTPVFILNANSLGGLDSNYFEGDGKQESKATKTIIEKSTSNISKTEQLNASLNHENQIASGIKTKTEIETMSDMLLNDHNFEVINSTLVPITIDKSQGIATVQKNGLQGVKLKYTRANNNINYTPDEFIG